MITDAPFAFPAAGLYIVSVGVTTLRTIRLPPRFSVCSRQVQFSDPGGVPGQMGRTPAASEVSGSGAWPRRQLEVTRRRSIRIRTLYYVSLRRSDGALEECHE